MLKVVGIIDRVYLILGHHASRVYLFSKSFWRRKKRGRRRRSLLVYNVLLPSTRENKFDFVCFFCRYVALSYFRFWFALRGERRVSTWRSVSFFSSGRFVFLPQFIFQNYFGVTVSRPALEFCYVSRRHVEITRSINQILHIALLSEKKKKLFVMVIFSLAQPSSFALFVSNILFSLDSKVKVIRKSRSMLVWGCITFPFMRNSDCTVDVGQYSRSVVRKGHKGCDPT